MFKWRSLFRTRLRGYGPGIARARPITPSVSVRRIIPVLFRRHLCLGFFFAEVFSLTGRTGFNSSYHCSVSGQCFLKWAGITLLQFPLSPLFGEILLPLNHGAVAKIRPLLPAIQFRMFLAELSL
jgi:hypothetical protein